MLSGNTTMMNDYIMFRLLVDDTDRHKQKRSSLQPPTTALLGTSPRASFMLPRGSIVSTNEPFCSPMVPHVPIRERLARRGTSADMCDDASAYTCYAPRRRRMSLLQSLRQQNRALADSGLDMHRQRTDSESTNRDTCSPTNNNNTASKGGSNGGGGGAGCSPPVTPTRKPTISSQIKHKIFGRKDKQKVYNNGEYSQSCDPINGVRSRKSPSTTNDSGRGSQGHLEDKMDALAINQRCQCGGDDCCEIERDAPILVAKKPNGFRRRRTHSCPDLSLMPSLCCSQKRCPIVDMESDEETHFERVKRACSPISAADCLVERRLNRKFVEQRRQQVAMSNIDEVSDDVVSRMSAMSRRSAQTEELADFDDNVSSIVLDQFLSSTHLNFDEDSDSLTGTIENEASEFDDSAPTASSSNTAASVQTDLTLLNVEQEIESYLEHCRATNNGISNEGFLANPSFASRPSMLL
ncbi:unnamed protein product [Caenorhabditis bovis]|uniref:Uncharacterized protein n=1 Tax=Caenorhabditis bovis TaxID=2654633 RepID=A0A8S1ERP8_9PELO|nr:unnamed protein product [Caenorhabditis bovis]